MSINQTNQFWLKLFNALFIKEEFIGHFDKNRTMLITMKVSGLHKLGRSEMVMKDFLSKQALDIKTKFLRNYFESSLFEPSSNTSELGIAGLLKGVPEDKQTPLLKDFFFNGMANGGKSWLSSFAAHVENGSIFGHSPEHLPPKQPSIDKSPLVAGDSSNQTQLGNSDHIVIAEHSATIASGVSFYRVIAQISPKIKFLTPSEAIKLFPNSGSMAVSPKLSSHPFKEDSLVCWALGEPDSNQSSHYSAIRQVAEFRVYVVYPVPFKLEQVDFIRENLIDFYSKTNYRNQLFKTTDGAFIRPNFSTAPVGENNFIAPLQVYWKVKTHSSPNFGEMVWDFSGVLAESFSFIPGAHLLKRFLRPLEVREKIKEVGFTKKVVSELTEELEKFASEYTEPTTIKRVKQILYDLGEFTDEAAVVGDFILNSQQFKHRIEKYADEAKRQVELDLAGIKGEIQRSLEEKKKIDQSLLNAQQSYQKSMKEFEVAVAKKFQDAVTRGRDVLVESALFKVLLSNQLQPVETSNRIIFTPTILPESAIQIRTIKDLTRQLEPFAELLGTVEPKYCTAFIGALMGCRNVLLDSDSPSRLSRAVASAFFGGVYLDVSLSGDVFSISDVLNLPTNLQGCESAPLPLGRALDQLATCDRPILLTVRGTNRVPEGIALQEMREWIKQAGQSGTSVSYATPKKIVERAKLPRDLFILYFVDHGETSIPISARTLAQLPLFSIPAPELADEDNDDALLLPEVMGEIDAFVREELRQHRQLSKGPRPVQERLRVDRLVTEFSSLAGIEIDESTRQNIFASETHLMVQHTELLKKLSLHGATTGSAAQRLFAVLSREGG